MMEVAKALGFTQWLLNGRDTGVDPEDIRRAAHSPKGEVWDIGRRSTHCPKCVVEKRGRTSKYIIMTNKSCEQHAFACDFIDIVFFLPANL